MGISIIIKIEYYNYLSVPSGNFFKLNELSNNEYLILLKFLNGENYQGFYETLDTLISKTISNFNNLDICDKIYIYLTYYFYSIRPTILLKSEKVSSIEVPLELILESIESNYIKKEENVKIYSWDMKIGYPKNIIFDKPNSISIDFLSSLREINDILIDEEHLEKLRPSIPIKIINEIEHKVKKYFQMKIDILDDENINENILSSNIFYTIAHIYKDSLDNFYNMQYLLTHYVRVSWDSLLKMTPIETTILYKNFITDKEKQNENNNNGTYDPNIEDSLMGY